MEEYYRRLAAIRWVGMPRKLRERRPAHPRPGDGVLQAYLGHALSPCLLASCSASTHAHRAA
jgi:hypothetical protein